MKEIIAIIRPRMMNATKAALADLGYPGVTAVAALGRGKQRGIAGEVDVELRTKLAQPPAAGGMKYIPKRQIILVVPDEQVEAIVEAIIRVNRTGQYGDGRIFVSPVENALRIRTGETGPAAIA